jgi:hypothetical protein
MIGEGLHIRETTPLVRLISPLRLAWIRIFESKTLSSFNHILMTIIVHDPCDRDRFSVLLLIGQSAHCWFLRESVEHSIPFLHFRLALSPVWRLPHCPTGMLQQGTWLIQVVQSPDTFGSRTESSPSGPVARHGVHTRTKQVNRAGSTSRRASPIRPRGFGFGPTGSAGHVMTKNDASTGWDCVERCMPGVARA